MSEFFALARAMEADAAARYTETARQLRQRGDTALAEVFDRLAVTERGHVQQVTAWAANQDEASSAINQLPWPLPDTFDAPPEEIASSKLVTHYRALASAVRHEQRSFAFWAYVSAHADTPEVKVAAERMALEELEHVSLLRRERRKAFHAERQGAALAESPISLASLASMERRLATFIEQNPQCAAGGGEFAVSIAAAARDAASKLDTLDAARSHPQLLAPSLPANLNQDVTAIAEYLAEAYLRLAEEAREESDLTIAHELAKAAIYRLGTLQSESDRKSDAPG
jgi:rubrerythrin